MIYLNSKFLAEKDLLRDASGKHYQRQMAIKMEMILNNKSDQVTLETIISSNLQKKHEVNSPNRLVMDDPI